MDLPGLYHCVWKLLLYALIHLRSLKEMLLLPSVDESDSLQVRIRTSRRWLVFGHPEAVDTVPEHQGADTEWTGVQPYPCRAQKKVPLSVCTPMEYTICMTS